MVGLLTREIIETTKKEAAASSRKRAIYKFHKPEDRCQRMINVLLKGTYVQPHRHLKPPKAEHFSVLEGLVAYIGFTDEGAIEEVHIMSPTGPVYAVDIPPGQIHTLVCLSKQAVIHEVIDGIFDSKTHKEFVNFAPAENEKDAPAYLAQLESTTQKILNNLEKQED